MTDKNAGGICEPASLTRADMAKRVEAGIASRLLAGGVPGPMRLAGSWWAVVEGTEDYQPVTDETGHRLEQHAARLHAAASAVHRAQTRECSNDGGLGRRP